MKRLIGVLFAASLASAVQASVGFEFGSQFFFPRYDPNAPTGAGLSNWSGQGQSFQVNWGLDNGIRLGAYTESTDLGDGYGNTYNFSVQEIVIGKEVIKNAAVLLKIGSFYETVNTVSGLCTDLVAAVTLISGSGDKVTGAIKANAGGRWADNTNNGGQDFSGYFLNLGVEVGI